MTAILEGEHVSKHFGGLAAVREVDFAIPERSIVGLIGPNGAGKTTLFNLIGGLYKPDAGRIRFQGVDITGWKPHAVCAAGIGRTFQIPKPFPNMSVFDNVLVAALFRSRGSDGTLRENRVKEILVFLGLQEKADWLARNLTTADKKALELARALGTGPRLLLLDEVAAGLTPVETTRLNGLINRARDELGITVLWIEHVMKAVMAVCEHIIVLHYGEKIAEGSPQVIAKEPRVVEAYLGEPEGADQGARSL